jgi:hypothetical protein
MAALGDALRLPDLRAPAENPAGMRCWQSGGVSHIRAGPEWQTVVLFVVLSPCRAVSLPRTKARGPRLLDTRTSEEVAKEDRRGNVVF